MDTKRVVIVDDPSLFEKELYLLHDRRSLDYRPIA